MLQPSKRNNACCVASNLLTALLLTATVSSALVAGWFNVPQSWGKFNYNQSKWVAFFQLCNSLLWIRMIWVFIRFNSCICWMLKITFSLSHLTHLCSDCLGVRIKAVNTINAFEENLKASNNEPILRTLVFHPIQKFVSAFTRFPLKHQTNPSMSTESVPFMNTSHCTDFKVLLETLRPIVNQYQQYNYCI